MDFVAQKPTSRNTSRINPPASPPVAPPDTNRGAQSTQKAPLKNRIVFDWLEFTLPENFGWRALENYLHIPGAKWVEAPKGLYGYRLQYLLGGVRLLTGGQDGMGHHCIISGAALRTCDFDIRNFVEFVRFQGGKFTRVDIALDVVDSTVRFPMLKSSLKRGTVTSLFKTVRSLEEKKICDGESLGETLYFGSKTSAILMRVYDKKKEAERSGDFEELPEDWVRFELQTRKERSEILIDKFLSDEGPIGEVFRGVLANYVQFRNCNVKDSNKYRWPLALWWEKLLEGTGKLALTSEKVFKTLVEKAQWVETQVGKTLAMIGLGLGVDRLEQIIKAGHSRLLEKDWDLVNLARMG